MTASPRDLRLLIMAPTARDGEITGELLNGAGIDTVPCRALSTLLHELNDGAAAALIALTGWGQDEDRQRSVAAGFNHHLVKPADIEQLRQLLTVA